MMKSHYFLGAVLGLAMVAAVTGCSTPPNLPTAKFHASSWAGEVPLEVSFTDESTPPAPLDGQKCNSTPAPPVLTQWAWDFGDGATATGTEVSHSYETPGLYTVKLTVTASDGTSATTVQRNRITALDPNRIQGTTAGEERTVAGLDFVWVPAGTFMMGSTLFSLENGMYLEEDASPPHSVTLTRGFWMSKYEMRQDYWMQVMATNPALYDELPPSEGYPIESVSWEDCQDFVDAMNEMDLGLFRLPTEAEWEYACRGGTTTLFSFDSTEEEVRSHTACVITSPYSTQPVGQFLPNPWGLYDMHGNVYEWVQDIYQSDYYTEEAQTDPTGPDVGPYRTVRGGSFRDPIYLLTSSTRMGYVTSSIYSFIGFRLVLQ